MVIDTSAIVAILLNEASAARLVAAVEADRTRLALAAARDQPLLFVGDDFAKTDVAVAKW